MALPQVSTTARRQASLCAIRPRPHAIQSLGDQAEVKKLKPNLTICRGC